MGLVALHDRVQTTATTLDGNTFTANKVQRHGCYQPTPIKDTPYGHSTFILQGGYLLLCGSKYLFQVQVKLVN
jgi:hypothetical protein